MTGPTDIYAAIPRDLLENGKLPRQVDIGQGASGPHASSSAFLRYTRGVPGGGDLPSRPRCGWAGNTAGSRRGISRRALRSDGSCG